MDKLVGKEAWLIQGCLYRVKIAKHDIGPPDLCEVTSIGLGTHMVPTMCLHLTTERAIESIELTVDYWRDQLKKLYEIQAQEADHAEH